jgi:TolB protein
MKYLLTLICLFQGIVTFAQQKPVGIFQDHADIGNPKKTGGTQYDETSQTYSLQGSGYNIWFGRDEFQYAFKKISGDFILTADFKFDDTANNPHKKIGWMVRASTDADAAHYTATVHADGLTVLQWRMLKSAQMRDPEDEVFTPKKNYQTLQMERVGKKIIMRAAHPGEPLQLIGATEMISMPNEALVGIFISSHDEALVEKATVWNVRIDKPAEEGYDPGKQGWLGCRLELMNIADGHRKVIRESAGRFEAPNWMPDGKKLLFNEGGSLFKIPIEGGNPEKLNTGIADNNNNDHGISFDGKMLAISHQRKDLPGGGSTVYVLPLEGGTPKLLTEKTPSYWHGWNPNGKEVAFVGQRDGKVYDIYKISVNGGEEVQLTHNKGTHVDGPEYSPDGKYIYYNGNTSGTMQIWRMRPDGTGNEQLTFDEYNSWFPHLSPDGKWIVYISFPPDIEVNAHPSYKRVMLQLMPVGGTPKTIAYLYGGQGTINVPSWSPDGKFIAFVSNSGKP